jgi:hypothetical protein
MTPLANAQLAKTIDSLKSPQGTQKEKLELLNRLVELSENVKDLASIVSIETFIKRFVQIVKVFVAP